MANTFILWLQTFLTGIGQAGDWLVSKPFQDTGIETLQDLTPLALIGIGGLIIFIVVAIVKWVIS